jgi:NTP pyrophosphatase (non-canonical NTP hydrolase)
MLTFGDCLDQLAVICHQRARANGFWDKERNKGEMIALMHSELSEMLEGVRKPGPDSHCPEFTSEEIELADLLIRAFDYAAAHQLRLGAALQAKLAFNLTRPYKHGKAF